MSNLRCQRSKELLSARSAGALSAADQILLSDHLDSCASCASWAKRHQKMTSLLKSRNEGLPTERLEQLAARFQNAEPAPVVFWTKPRLRLSLALAFGTALAAMLALLLLPRLLPQEHFSLTLVEGQVTLKEQGERRAPGGLIQDGTLIETNDSQATLMSTNQKIILAAHSIATFEARGEERWLLLSSGTVFLQSDSLANEFLVEAGALTARPVGTRFMVSREGATVAVLDGLVDVSFLENIQRIKAGQEYKQGGEAKPLGQKSLAALQAAFGVVVEPPTSVAAMTLSTSQLAQSEPASETVKSAPSKTLDIAKEIKEIEALLRQKEPTSARRRAYEALDTEPAQKEAARLRTLIAESYMAERNYTSAHQAYLLVFRSFPKTRDGAEALLTAGILELEQMNEAAAAQSSFEKYLSRYPNGALRESAHFYLCQALLRQEKKSEASKAAAEYIKEFPAGEFASSLRPLLIEDH